MMLGVCGSFIFIFILEVSLFCFLMFELVYRIDVRFEIILGKIK